VTPSRENAEQDQNKNDEKNGADAHGVSPCAAKSLTV
jgi:hypothetical protein